MSRFDIDWFDVLFGAFFGLMLLIIFGAIVGVVVDLAQERRAFDAKVACEARRMEPRRQSFTARVTCIPVNTRQDTSTVQVKVQP